MVTTFTSRDLSRLAYATVVNWLYRVRQKSNPLYRVLLISQQRIRIFLQKNYTAICHSYLRITANLCLIFGTYMSV